MRTIHKFRLDFMGICEIQMPYGTQVVHVGEQDDVIHLWAIVDTTVPMTVRRFRVAGTGHGLVGGEYLGTAHLKGLGLVFHVFDIGENAE